MRGFHDVSDLLYPFADIICTDDLSDQTHGFAPRDTT